MQHLLFYPRNEETMQMDHDRRRGLSGSQKNELWERWRRGESSQDIARAFGKFRRSIYSVLSSSGVSFLTIMTQPAGGFLTIMTQGS
jgi:hypothetical protein